MDFILPSEKIGPVKAGAAGPLLLALIFEQYHAIYVHKMHNSMLLSQYS